MRKGSKNIFPKPSTFSEPSIMMSSGLEEQIQLDDPETEVAEPTVGIEASFNVKGRNFKGNFVSLREMKKKTRFTISLPFEKAFDAYSLLKIRDGEPRDHSVDTITLGDKVLVENSAVESMEIAEVKLQDGIYYHLTITF